MDNPLTDTPPPDILALHRMLEMFSHALYVDVRRTLDPAAVIPSDITHRMTSVYNIKGERQVRPAFLTKLRGHMRSLREARNAGETGKAFSVEHFIVSLGVAGMLCRLVNMKDGDVGSDMKPRLRYRLGYVKLVQKRDAENGVEVWVLDWKEGNPGDERELGEIEKEIGGLGVAGTGDGMEVGG